jgi:putative Mg2+ transporter-C (MgtC) family protein
MTRLSVEEMLLRISVAFVAGAIIGWERETHGRPAGLRTTILTCVAAAVAMVLSEVLFIESGKGIPTGSWRPDPARLGAGILTGIGFLGAGTILRHGNAIRGVTTAATLWFVTVLGLAFGSGEFTLGFAGMVLAAIALFVLAPFEKHIPSNYYVTLSVTSTLNSPPIGELKQRIERSGPRVKSTRVAYNLEKQQQTVIYELILKNNIVQDALIKVLEDLRVCPGVLRARWF